MMPQRRTLEDLRFDNTYAKLPEAFYAKLNPTPFSTPPHLISFNPAAAALIDLETPNSRTEFWFGYRNFYVITRYNRSSFYAMSVFELAEAIRRQRTLRLASEAAVED